MQVCCVAKLQCHIIARILSSSYCYPLHADGQKITKPPSPERSHKCNPACNKSEQKLIWVIITMVVLSRISSDSGNLYMVTITFNGSINQVG